MNFRSIFADLYFFLVGAGAKLAKKPKPWRISLLLELMYGGWTQVRDAVFYTSKNTEFLTLINLVDNYIPLVLIIYSYELHQ